VASTPTTSGTIAGCHHAASQRDARRPDHDDHKTRRGQRRQAGSNAQQSREDQPDGSKHFGDADEAKEQARQRDRSCQLVERQHQLHPSREHEQSRQQPLDNPQQNDSFSRHRCLLLLTRRTSHPEIDSRLNGVRPSFYVLRKSRENVKRGSDPIKLTLRAAHISIKCF
jgi:hypothetical protein